MNTTISLHHSRTNPTIKASSQISAHDLMAGPRRARVPNARPGDSPNWIRTAKKWFLLGLAVLPGLPAIAQLTTTGQVLASSSFDTNDEGWLQGASVDSEASRPLVYQFGGGYSGGGIQTSLDHGWFQAPAKFLGDKSQAYGGRLEYDYKQNKSGGAGLGFAIRLYSGGLILGSFGGKQPPTTFEHVTHILDEKSGWYNRGTGKLASREEMIRVLSHLDLIEIRADFTTATDNVAWLDNVQLVAGPTAPVIRAETPNLLSLEGDVGLYEVQFRSELDAADVWKPFFAVKLPGPIAARLDFQLYSSILGRSNLFFRAVHAP
ncbi:MAG: hypothetical protein IT581_08910 [Verrucomicrobiales bacterium]|nr:hypothetical protein [Verrucomicrobiales bacterium]